MKKRCILATSAVVTLCMISSCATIVTGTKPKVIICGDTNEPVTIRTSYKTYENVMLPVQVQVKREHISGQRISVSSENYTYQDIMLDKKTNGWAWGNLAIGGIVGWIIDLVTNAVSEPRQKEYKVHGVQKNSSENQNGINNGNSKIQSSTNVEKSTEITLPPLPCDAIIEKKNGKIIDASIHSVENGFVLYHLKGKSQFETSTIEASKVKKIKIIDKAFKPSLPCDAEIKLSKNSHWTPVKLHGIEQSTIKYDMNGKKTYSKSLDAIYEIRFLIPNSIEKYNVKMYYYKIKGLTMNF